MNKQHPLQPYDELIAAVACFAFGVLVLGIFIALQ